MKQLITTLILATALVACRTGNVPRGCRPTTEDVFKSFPNRTWGLLDTSYHSKCIFYNPILYFGADGRCAFSNRLRTLPCTYEISRCDNAVQIYLPEDTILFIVSSLTPKTMTATELKASPDNELNATEWHFREWSEPKNPDGR